MLHHLQSVQAVVDFQQIQTHLRQSREMAFSLQARVLMHPLLPPSRLGSASPQSPVIICLCVYEDIPFKTASQIGRENYITPGQGMATYSRLQL